MAVATDKHEIRLLQTADGQPGPILTGHTEAITGLRFSRDGNVLYSGSLDLTVRQWDLLSGKEIARLNTPAAVQADSTATDAAGLVTDFNALLAKLKAAGLMAADE